MKMNTIKKADKRVVFRVNTAMLQPMASEEHQAAVWKKAERANKRGVCGGKRVWVRQSEALLRADGVEPGDLVQVDFSKMPRQSRRNADGKRIYDLVLCRAVYPRAPFRSAVMLAEYVGVFGARQTVCTRPLSEEGLSLGCAFEAEEILATVSAVFDGKRRLKKIWDLRHNPEMLSATDTIHLSD